jgi:hypothetical protein
MTNEFLSPNKVDCQFDIGAFDHFGKRCPQEKHGYETYKILLFFPIIVRHMIMNTTMTCQEAAHHFMCIISKSNGLIRVS